MSFRNYRLGNQLLGVNNCPHCGVSHPVLKRAWASDGLLDRADGGHPSRWAAFSCTSCGHVVLARGDENDKNGNAYVAEIFPDIWQVDGIVPERVRNYLTQAHRTLSSPDASTLMSAASIDAMLKDHGLEEGSLYSRIDEAITKGILTQHMADWAHRVRLDSNNPRHADSDRPNLSADDARRAFDYANALTQYLYILPSKMPEATE